MNQMAPGGKLNETQITPGNLWCVCGGGGRGGVGGGGIEARWWWGDGGGGMGGGGTLNQILTGEAR